jgi:hypothetical protein
MAMNTLTRVLRPEQTPAWSATIAASWRAFETFIGQPAFPRVGARAAQPQTLLVHDIHYRVIAHA